MRSGTQKMAILEHLKDKGSITSNEAFSKYGATRLAAIVHKLRKNYDIVTQRIDTTNRYGEHCQYARYIYKGELNESVSN